MDIFDRKAIDPMLIKTKQQPFDSDDYLYELKIDGIRCIAYLDKDSVSLRNKRDRELLPSVPELAEIYNLVNSKCILDTELTILKGGAINFHEIQRRILMTDPFKISLASQRYPASLVVHDILYKDGKETIYLPIEERKEILKNIVIEETSQFAMSKYIYKNGIALFNYTTQNNLEGVVAKRLGSTYQMGKRSADWIKFKNMCDDDYVLCGYVYNHNDKSSIVIGKYRGDKLVIQGFVSLGVNIRALQKYPIKYRDKPLFNLKDTKVQWLEPTLVCTIEHMPDSDIRFRQPSLKGIRDDKDPRECQIEEESGD